MKANRMSILPVAERCGLAPHLADRYGAGMAAQQSTAYHAWIAKSPGWEELWNALTDEQRGECEGWGVPAEATDVPGLGDYTGKWSHEVELQLTEDLEAHSTLDPDDMGVSTGHADLIASGVPIGEQRMTLSPDFKRTRHTSHPESLQVHAYGWTSAKAAGDDGYIPGIYVLDEGEWWWGEPVTFGTERAERIGGRLRAAMLNSADTGTMGPHCTECYARMHCPEFLIPVTSLVRQKEPDLDLEAFAGEKELTAEMAAKAVLALKGLKELAELIKSTLQAFSHQNDGIEADGKVWSGQKTNPRPKLITDQKALMADVEKLMPELFQKHTRMGTTKAQTRYQWRKKK